MAGSAFGLDSRLRGNDVVVQNDVVMPNAVVVGMPLLWEFLAQPLFMFGL